jgi:hypothetical protein
VFLLAMQSAVSAWATSSEQVNRVLLPAGEFFSLPLHPVSCLLVSGGCSIEIKTNILAHFHTVFKLVILLNFFCYTPSGHGAETQK